MADVLTLLHFHKESALDFQERVLKKLDKIQDDVSELKIENTKQTANIERNTKDLAEHIEGVKQTRALIKQHENDKQIHKEPLTVKTLFMNLVFVFGGVGTIAGATYGVLRLLDMLK